MAFRKAVSTGENAKIATVEPIRSKHDIARIRSWFILNDYKKYEVLFMIGCYTGLRAGDIVRLKVKDVLKDGKIRDQIEIREEKTAKIKKFPINEHVSKLLYQYIKKKDPEDNLFEGRDGEGIDRSQIYRMIVRVCQELKIDVNVGTHTMRKTFGYHHYKQFKDIGLLQEIFNHSGPDVTRRYIGITQDEINESYKALNLEDEDNSLIAKAEKIAGNNKTRMNKVVTFIKEYLKQTCNKGTYAPFAFIILEILGYNKSYIEKGRENNRKGITQQNLSDRLQHGNYSDERLAEINELLNKPDDLLNPSY